MAILSNPAQDELLSEDEREFARSIVHSYGEIVRAGFLSAPICGRPFDGHYRMNINLPLANSCGNCRRVYRARYQ